MRTIIIDGVEFKIRKTHTINNKEYISGIVLGEIFWELSKKELVNIKKRVNTVDSILRQRDYYNNLMKNARKELDVFSSNQGKARRHYYSLDDLRSNINKF